MPPLQSLAYFMVTFIDFYMLLIFARVLLSWFPAIDWYRQPWIAIRSATDPVMDPFRRFLPTLGGIDFSPILIFLILGFLKSLIEHTFLVVSPVNVF